MASDVERLEIFRTRMIITEIINAEIMCALLCFSQFLLTVPQATS